MMRTLTKIKAEENPFFDFSPLFSMYIKPGESTMHIINSGLKAQCSSWNYCQFLSNMRNAATLFK